MWNNGTVESKLLMFAKLDASIAIESRARK